MRNRFVGLMIPGIALAVLLPFELEGQSGTITGTVRGADTGLPLSTVIITVLEPDGRRAASILTNVSGEFRATVPAGTYVITAVTTGRQTGRLEAVSVAAGETAAVDFELEIRALDLDPISVTASRREERALDAPARVEVVARQAIQDRPAIQPMDHVRGVAGVDIVNQGIQSTNVVARGFNNIFSGALLALTDHRIAGVPSLRLNALHLVPATNDDLERVEVVLGPGSALYGPNTANGVMHMFTFSPLTEQGTTVSITGGERSIFHGTARTATMLGEALGIKISGEYLRGEEWEFQDPIEVSARTSAIQEDPDTRIGLRDFDVEKWAFDARADWRVTPDATAIFSVGRTTAVKNLEMTGIGASQVRNWSYTYYQARFNRNRLFAQTYLNVSDAGETFRLRDGAATIDNSRLWVAQIQHGFAPRPWQDFTYGVDYIRTMPDTEGSIHGRFEDEDEYTESGVFLQSSTNLSPRFDLVLAGRYDYHSVVDASVFSPRAALVFKPAEGHALRLSFNRAYSNPSSVNLFLDLGAGPAGETLGPLGFTARALGTGRDGIRFEGEDGLYYMRSPFGAAPGQAATPVELTQLREINVQNLWEQQVRGIARALTLNGTFDQSAAAAFVGFMLPQAPEAMGIFGLNTVTETLSAFTAPADVPGIRESTVTSYEVGYKGLLGDRVLLAADVWYTERDNFVSPLLAQNSLLLLNPLAAFGYAQPRIEQFLIAGGASAEEAAAQSAVIAQGMAALPGGVLTAPGLELGPEILVSYRNFGDINLWGADLAAQALYGRWNAGVSLSLVSDDYFISEGQLIALNSPKTKGSVSVGYRDEAVGWNGELRARYSAGFPAQSGTYVGLACVPESENADPCVESHTVFDLTLGVRIPQVPGASLQLTVQNLFDSGYKSFVGAPELGRMALLRLRYDL